MRLGSDGMHRHPREACSRWLFESTSERAELDSTDLQVPKEKLAQPRPAPFGCACYVYGLNLHRALESVGITRREYSPANFQTITGLVTKDTRYLVTDNLEIMHLTTSNSVSVLSKMRFYR